MKPNISSLSDRYLFSEIGEIISKRNNIINLSIGDVTLPLPHAVVRAGMEAARELERKETFRGYPPEAGYDFFISAVSARYKNLGVEVREDEIFVSDGIKSDLGSFLSVTEQETALIKSPSYPAYIDACAIRGKDVEFYAELPTEPMRAVIFVCSPDNPTGVAMTREELQEWVDYARRSGSLILYDAAYEAFVTSGRPRSIFEIEGARECAVEFCSLSKTAGFTGVRCGYTVVPRECGLNAVWRRVKSCMSNGVSYITQRMAACALTEAYDDVMNNVRYYNTNAAIMLEALGGAEFSGGVDSPYIWLRCGRSYDEFYKLLDMYGLGVTPGAGFGRGGEEYVRINAFCSRQDAEAARERLARYLFYK